MKKNVTGKCFALAAAVAGTVFFTACGGGNSLAGSYILTEVEIAGMTMDVSELAEMAGLDSSAFSVSIDLNSDGSMVMNGEDMGIGSGEGTWEANGNSIDLTVEGDTISAEVSGNSIILEEPSSGMSMTFEK